MAGNKYGINLWAVWNTEAERDEVITSLKQIAQEHPPLRKFFKKFIVRVKQVEETLEGEDVT